MNTRISNNVRVAAAVIIYNGLILCAQRKQSINPELSLKWEFPGGKIEKEETPEIALSREIQEELGLTIFDVRSFGVYRHEYLDFNLEMAVFQATIEHLPTKIESHVQFKLLPVDQLDTLDWAAADWPIVKNLKSQIHQPFQFTSNRTEYRFLDQLLDLFNDGQFNHFNFSVSFIKIAGLNEIYDSMCRFLSRSGKSGKLLTTTYQFFTDPESLIKLLRLSRQYPKFELRIDVGGSEHRGFHTKGFLFSNASECAYLIGSTNLTKQALTLNEEWNLMIKSTINEGYLSIIREFEYLWNQSKVVTEAIIEDYQKYYKSNIVRDFHQEFISTLQPITYNAMQKEALEQLEMTRNRGGKRSLIVSATGSGKTYLAAFDVQQIKTPRVSKLLFVVHRDKIRFDALSTFRQVFHDEYTYGFFDGKIKDLEVDFLFASNIALSQNLAIFPEDLFDYIVIDEAHHAPADTIKKIIEHFKPRFMLGLTATPHRMDGADVFALFDNNLSYVLTLREAIRDNLIVPFHYYGIKDDVSYKIDDLRKNFSLSEISRRAELLHHNIEKYIVVTDKLRAIGFCRSINEASLMAELMKTYGYNSAFMNATTSYQERKSLFDSIEADQSDSIDIIFTVDILNEGVDIPSINTVFFLRPTESHVVFTQQLGRGLRKYPGKEYLTVLDFIGNHYDRAQQLAVALTSLVVSGDQSNRKMIKIIKDDFKNLDIPISINLDELSKEEILRKLEKSSDINKKKMMSEYNNFKAYLSKTKNQGKVHIPTHEDFCLIDFAPNLATIIEKYGSYYDFLLVAEPSNSYIFTNDEVDIIRSISSLIPIVQNHAFVILKLLLTFGSTRRSELYIKASDSIKDLSLVQFDYALRLLSGQIAHSWLGKNNMRINVLANIDDTIIFNSDNPDLHRYLIDLISYGLFFWRRNYSSNDLVVHRNYRQSDIDMIMRRDTLFQIIQGEWWKRREDLTILYITLQKDENKDVLYRNSFVNRWLMNWDSKGGKREKDIKDYTNRSNLHIFVRKDSQSRYYFLGLGQFENPRLGKVTDGQTKKLKVVITTQIKLVHPVDNEIYYELAS